MSIKLKTYNLDVDDKTFVLRCNFNVIGEIQENYGGMSEVLKTYKGMSLTRLLVAVMMNDYADEMGWPKKNYTPKEVGRLLPTSPKKVAELGHVVMDMIVNAMMEPSEETEDSEKNLMTTQEETEK